MRFIRMAVLEGCTASAGGDVEKLDGSCARAAGNVEQSRRGGVAPPPKTLEVGCATSTSTSGRTLRGRKQTVGQMLAHPCSQQRGPRELEQGNK